MVYVCGGRVRVGGWRATTAFDLWFCVGAPAAGPAHAPLEASPSDRLAACRQGFPRCTRDISTQTLKILGSWMYALAYVNCDSFSFPFFGRSVGGRARPRQRPASPTPPRLYLPSLDYQQLLISRYTIRYPCRGYTSSITLVD